MMRPSIAPLLLGLIALPGCSSSEDDHPSNPRVLWLAPFDSTELQVRLADTEPPPY